MMLLNTYRLEGQISFSLLAIGLVLLLIVVGIIWRHRTLKARLNRARIEILRRFDEDRRLLSTELHDVVGSFLVPLKSEVEHLAPEKQADWTLRMQEFEQFIRQTSHMLYPDYIFKGDFNDALTQLPRFLSTDQTQINVHVQFPLSLDHAASHHLFRCVLEVLTNAIKYDRPERIVVVTASAPNRFQVLMNYEVEMECEGSGTGIGLQILNERLRAIKGTLVQHRDDAHRQLTISIPTK